jgi:hypothetical protein
MGASSLGVSRDPLQNVSGQTELGSFEYHPSKNGLGNLGNSNTAKIGYQPPSIDTGATGLGISGLQLPGDGEDRVSGAYDDVRQHIASIGGSKDYGGVGDLNSFPFEKPL